MQENNPINASQSYTEESWHGIDQELESPTHSLGHDGRATLPSKTTASGSGDETLDVRLLNARLDVSLCLN